MENRTTEVQNVINTVHACVRTALLELRAAERDLEAIKETGAIKDQLEAFESYVKALDSYRTVTSMGLDVITALGDGFEEYNAALGRAVEEVE